MIRWREADIVINNETLTVAQSMTIRVALGVFSMTLLRDDALGGDDIGLDITKGYRRSLTAIQMCMEKVP